MDYLDIYKKRLNRYGADYQSRVQGEREKLFEHRLLKSIYRVVFNYGDEEVEGTLERRTQDQTKTTQYLLVRIDQFLDIGTVLKIGDNHWLVFFLENIVASGYNRYIVIKMSHLISWTKNGEEKECWGYLHGKGSAVLRDSSKSGSVGKHSLYLEDSNESFLIMPMVDLEKGDYFELDNGFEVEPFRVVGRDIQTTPGAMYVTLDPTYERDKSSTPKKEENDKSEDFFWFGGDE